MIDQERATRFRDCMGQIEVTAEKLRHGLEPDILGALARIAINLAWAQEIAQEVSREALDKVSKC